MGNNFCCGNKPQNQGELKMVNNKNSKNKTKQNKTK